jgi:pimeloyl-ACP methyl ester carboxylesterase
VIKGESAFVSNPQGLRLWTERFGEPADPVVLLVMGTSAQAIGWPDELVAALVSGGRQVIRFDHRDTGQSDCVDFAVAPYSLNDMAGDALSVLDGYQVAAAHIAGDCQFPAGDTRRAPSRQRRDLAHPERHRAAV